VTILLFYDLQTNYHNIFAYFIIFTISSVVIATGYGLEDGGVGVRVPVEQEFSLFHVVQTDPGVHPISYTMSTGGFSSGMKRPGRKADHSYPTSAEVKKIWIYTSTPRKLLMAYCLISQAQGQLHIFTLPNTRNPSVCV
jgi:hypothetical protein